ncbi:hypothetical protein KUTeg_001079 [Tegillarca granosa]|uniref:YqaJ viral recombinase domain-containing protein n=1 Tax=Tegillarca granosa TaxID=220873 RepID=A0ABQ9FYP3_TEGGR|nr:hypothetical protein KUTeg_001079 [Tegillarca granosa]
MERKVYKVNVCLSVNGDVLGGSCMCVAGPQLGKKPRLSVSRSDIRHPDDRCIDEKALKDLHEKMSQCVPNSGFAKYGLKRNYGQLPVTDSTDTPSYITTHPPSLNDIKCASEHFFNNLSVSDSEISDIEKTTTDQSFSRRDSTDPSRLVSQILGHSNVKTRGMKFGLKMEKQAQSRYMKYLKNENLEIVNSGLRVSKDLPFLGASPDGILKDLDGNIDRLVEFKNPSSTWRLSLKEAALILSCLKLNENHDVSLNVNDKYYSQIQGQM